MKPAHEGAARRNQSNPSSDLNLADSCGIGVTLKESPHGSCADQESTREVGMGQGCPRGVSADQGSLDSIARRLVRGSRKFKSREGSCVDPGSSVARFCKEDSGKIVRRSRSANEEGHDRSTDQILSITTNDRRQSYEV